MQGFAIGLVASPLAVIMACLKHGAEGVATSMKELQQSMCQNGMCLTEEKRMSEAREMQKAAILMARAAELNALVTGMEAENALKWMTREKPAYTKADFDDAILLTGCHHNAIQELLQGD